MTTTPLHLSVGVDVGGTNTVFGLVDRQGRIVAEGSIPTCDYPEIDKFVAALHDGITALVKSMDCDCTLVGVGIGAPNANYYRGTIENAANLCWRGVVPLAEKVRGVFPGLPVVMTNDAKAAAVGEMTYGGAKGMKDFIVITLGTGLGSGFVANGDIIYGEDSYAGELGHTIVRHGGRICGCGREGCLETYASATGIKRTIFKLLADRTDPSTFRAISYNDLTAKMITDAALEGDPIAIAAFEHTGEALGLALANAVAITRPEAIFLFGGLAKAGKYLFEPTKRYMEQNMLAQYCDKVKLLPSGLGELNAAVLGASALIWDEIGKKNQVIA